MQFSFSQIKEFYIKNERHISSGALLFGFVMDNLTLTRIDLPLDNFILATYLFVASLGIAMVSLYDNGRLQFQFMHSLKPWLPLPIQFAFGGLFSGFLIFYTRSASLISSWPFLFFLLFLLLGNERFRERYRRITFPISILFIAVFSYSIFVVPMILNRMGPWVFVLSGFVSVVVILIYAYALHLFIPSRIKESKKRIIVSVGSIFLVINVLYFLNIIPPIPLSLKEAGVYHNVMRVGERYEVITEKKEWKDRFVLNEKIHLQKNDPIYLFSSVFAPADLDIKIVHSWQYLNPKTGEWITMNEITFPIQGGRDGGYRGFSKKGLVLEGKWRVNIETERGQLLGRKKFNVEIVEDLPELVRDYR